LIYYDLTFWPYLIVYLVWFDWRFQNVYFDINELRKQTPQYSNIKFWPMNTLSFSLPDLWFGDVKITLLTLIRICMFMNSDPATSQ
jgi:hypothetical protein